MNAINKIQTLIIAVAVILGILLGQNETIGSYARYFIVPFLMIMLYCIFLNIPVKDLAKGFVNTKFLSVSLLINFLWTPIVAYFLGFLFLENHLSLWIGFVMLMVTPCTDWYLIFTNLSKGNTPLAASILPLNLLLQVILLPIYLLLFFNKTGTLEINMLIESILLVLMVPFILAQLTRYFAFKTKKINLIENRILPFIDPFQVIFLGLAILAMFASNGEYLTNNLNVLYILLFPLLLFFLINFLLSRFIGHLLKFSYEDSVSLSLTTIARNSPISLAIAVTAFPDKPLISLALVIGPLIELPILALISYFLLRIKKMSLE
ncbi:MAG: bile acid:sodium symporter [Cyclobacteriaceae bacterium]